MEENILSTILNEVDEFRAGKNRSLLGKLESDFEPMQFVQVAELDLGQFIDSDEQPPASQSVPFILLGEKSDDQEEVGLGFWEINLN
ncbi:MAG: hypothetical protein ABEK50_05310 [bacterium]